MSVEDSKPKPSIPLLRDNQPPEKVLGSKQILESPSIRPEELNTELSSKIDQMNSDFNDKLQKLITELRANSMRTIDKPYDNIETFIKRISTTQQAKQDKADYTYTVKTDRTVTLKHLSLVPDTSFATLGLCQIDIGEKFNAFSSVDGDFTDLGSVDVIKQSSKGFNITRRKKTIDAFIWSKDGTKVSMTLVGLIAWDDIEK